MPISTSGKVCSACWAFALLLLIIGYLTASAAKPTGELRQWYGTELCFSPNSSFSVKGRAVYDAFLLRPSAGWEPGSACPTVVDPTTWDSGAAVSGTSGGAATIEIALEADDGFRFDAQYKPLFLLPSGSYATMSIEIVDAKGAPVLNQSIYGIGPDDNYPWMAPAADLQPAPELTNDNLDCDCSDACAYGNDGSCDDGGDGAEFGVCAVGGDCSDCGSRCDDDDDEEGAAPSASPAAAAAAAAASGRRLLFAPLRGRRLLKGGSGGGGGVGGGSRGGIAGGGGRASTTGTGAWGASRPSRVSPAARGAVIASASGRRYYGSSRPYSYFYARNVVVYGSVLYVVGYGGHGCYSCVGYGRTCRSCDNCRSRAACGGVTSSVMASNFDRYELEEGLRTPGRGAPQWPLTLKLRNATVFHPRSGDGVNILQSASLYVNFFTTDGDGYDTVSGYCMPFGYLLIFICTFVILFNRSSFFPAERAPVHSSWVANPGGRATHHHHPARTAPITHTMAMATATPPPPPRPIAHAIAHPIDQSAIVPGGYASTMGSRASAQHGQPNPPLVPPAPQPHSGSTEMQLVPIAQPAVVEGRPVAVALPTCQGQVPE